MTTPWIYWGGTFRWPQHFQFKDNLSWQKGTHSLRFGTDIRIYRFNNQRSVGSNPQGSGISVFPSVFFTRGIGVPFTGIQNSSVVPNTTDRNRLEGVFNEVLGIVTQMDQAMYSNGQVYLPGNAFTMYQRQREYSFYAQDDWRITNRLTLNLGLRYELFGVPFDKSGLQVVPDRGMDQGPVTFLPAGPGTGRSWYKMDKNDFAPAVGVAWDPRGDGRMVVRGGYRISYNRLVGWALNVLEQRQPAIALSPQIRGECRNPSNNTFELCGGNFAVPMRLNELALHPRVQVMNGLASLKGPEPNQVQRTPPPSRRESPFFFADDFRTAHVHQFSLNIQREIGNGMIAEVGYVGTLGRNLFKFENVNQIDVINNGFLQEFINAQTNLGVCRANPEACLARQLAAGVAAANRSTSTFGFWGLPGQVRLPILSALFSSTGDQSAAGFRNTTHISSLELNAVGAMANRLDRSENNSRGPLAAFGNNQFFRPNPQFDVAGLGTSNGVSDYHSLQLQVRGRLRNSMQFAANYTFSKSLDNQSNETVGAGTGFDFPYDSKNISLNRARSDFDVTHVFRGFVIHDLPWGRGRRWGSDWSPLLQHVLGGWQVNTIADISSGFGQTVSSGVSGTLNYFVTVPADCAPGALKAFKLQKSKEAGRILYFDGNKDASFSVPTPGKMGTCGRNTLSGPGFIQFDIGILKSFDVADDWKLDFRTEIFNAFNKTNFGQANTNIQSGSFGLITGTRAPNRIIQFGLKLNF
jgi:hypothetical protein